MFRKKAKPAPLEVAEQPQAKILLPVEAVVSLGGWYPRTILHLQEIYTFFSNQLDDQQDSEEHRHKLRSLHYDLGIVSVAKQAGYLEYVRAMTAEGIEIRYYEDGLYVLDVSSHDPAAAQQLLDVYHRQKLAPALQQLFAKGAPLPEAAQMGVKGGPAIVWLHWPHPNRFEPDPMFGSVFSKVSSDDLAVFKLADYIFLVYAQPGSAQIRDLLEMQLFFEQFQGQLTLSLRQFRAIWSDAAVIAERGRLKIGQIDKGRSVLYQLRKRASMEEGRLQQSVLALQTRADIAQQLELDQYLVQLFHYRFEVLEDGLRYLEQSWKMAIDYIEQTQKLLDGLSGQYARSVSSWSLGLLLVLAVSSLVGWLAQGQSIAIEHSNFMAFAGVLLVGLGIFALVAMIIKQQDFSLKYASRRSADQAVKSKDAKAKTKK